MNTVAPKFKSAAGSEFSRELRMNVENYFRTHNISKFADKKLRFKAAVLITTFVFSYLVMMIFSLPVWVMAILAIVMGVAKAGIGMGVMHDANHGSFSKNPKVNRFFGKSADVLGVSSNNWINQHNKLHHTYTNIHGHDEDIDGKGLFRFSTDAPYKKMHRFQFLYWSFFYGFLTLGWFFADLSAYGKYRKRGLNKSTGKKKRREIAELVFFKVLYLVYMIALPMIFMDVAWWTVLIGVLIVEFTAGMILSVIFQLAHVVDELDLTNSVENGVTKDEWTVHQLKNTFNFAVKNKVITWFCGGLNFQVEHHLFPNISHAHYPKLNRIVRDTAAKYNINYQEFKTFRSAFISHLTFLRKLGRPNFA